jgi:hypothetical protein
MSDASLMAGVEIEPAGRRASPRWSTVALTVLDGIGEALALVASNLRSVMGRQVLGQSLDPVVCGSGDI